MKITNQRKCSNNNNLRKRSKKPRESPDQQLFMTEFLGSKFSAEVPITRSVEKSVRQILFVPAEHIFELEHLNCCWEPFFFNKFVVMCRRRQPMREIEGASHQAEVGDDLHDISEAANERDRDVRMWGSDCHLSKSQIRKYMVEAEKNNMPPEKAHEILAYCKFDTSKALKICQNFVVPDLLSDYEKHVVQCAVRGEKFDMLSVPDPSQRSRLLKELLPQLSRGTIMDYYYKNKHNNFDFECKMDHSSLTEQSDVLGRGDTPNS